MNQITDQHEMTDKKVYRCRICEQPLTDEEVFCLKPRDLIITCFKHNYLSQSKFDSIKAWAGKKYNMKINKQFWISIKKAENCLFSRRNGYKGKVILGYSLCIRLFGYNYV